MCRDRTRLIAITSNFDIREGRLGGVSVGRVSLVEMEPVAASFIVEGHVLGDGDGVAAELSSDRLVALFVRLRVLSVHLPSLFLAVGVVAVEELDGAADVLAGRAQGRGVL